MEASKVLSAWPEIPPDERGADPKPVFVSETLSAGLRAELAAKGWSVRDIRLLSGAERAYGKLEGIASGTIPAPKDGAELRALELDLRAHKLLSDKGSAPKADEDRSLKGEDEIAALLTFGRSEHTNTPAIIASPLPLAVLPEKRRGRPKGAKDSKPRPSSGPARGVALQKKQAKEQRRNPQVLAVPAEES